MLRQQRNCSKNNSRELRPLGAIPVKDFRALEVLDFMRFERNQLPLVHLVNL